MLFEAMRSFSQLPMSMSLYIVEIDSIFRPISLDERTNKKADTRILTMIHGGFGNQLR